MYPRIVNTVVYTPHSNEIALLVLDCACTVVILWGANGGQGEQLVDKHGDVRGGTCLQMSLDPSSSE